MVLAFDLDGRKGIITGAASGIGRATAQFLAQQKASLYLNDLNRDGLDSVAKEINEAGGPRPLTFVGDVVNEEQVDEMVSGALQGFGGLDFLVNCAGILRRGPFLDINTAEWDLMLNVNLRSVFLCCKAVLPAMMSAKGGVIVNVASVAGRTASVLGGAHYTAAKHGVIGLTRHLAREFGPHGIRINSFCPGATLTPMVDKASDTEEKQRIAEAIPLRRWAKPGEQAWVITFLLSSASKNITGACLDSNGGILMI